MKKLLFTLAVSTLLFSCEKEVVEQKSVSTETSGCDCGEISDINYILADTLTIETVIYNGCSANDTTVYYIPQTNAGNDKSIGDPHCLGVSW